QNDQLNRHYLFFLITVNHAELMADKPTHWSYWRWQFHKIQRYLVVHVLVHDAPIALVLKHRYPTIKSQFFAPSSIKTLLLFLQSKQQSFFLLDFYIHLILAPNQ